MADDDKTPETTPDEATSQAADVPAPETAVEAPEAEATPEPEAPAEPEAAAEPEAPAPAEPKEPEVQLTPKERRSALRARRAAKRGPGITGTPEERAAARKELRAGKAVARRRRRLQEREKAKAYRAENPAQEPQHAPDHGPGRPKTRQGKVISAKPDKTIIVKVDAARRHRRYEKIVRSSSTLHVHDETNDANEGDLVRVIESRPLSRTKRWRLTDVLERAK